MLPLLEDRDCVDLDHHPWKSERTDLKGGSGGWWARKEFCPNPSVVAERANVCQVYVQLDERVHGSPGSFEDRFDVLERLSHLSIEIPLADAALEATRATVEPRFEASGDAAERLEALVRAVQQGFAETEEFGRTIIRATVGASTSGTSGTAPRRGYRRVEWIERALEPLRDTLPSDRFERLVSALTLLIGWEAMIVLQDTRGLSSSEAEEICVWTARTLLAAETMIRPNIAERPRA